MVYNLLLGSINYIILNGLNNGTKMVVQIHHKAFNLKKKKGGNNNMESLKNYSRAVNIIVFICSLITYLGVDGLNNIVPDEYKYIIPTIAPAQAFKLSK